MIENPYPKTITDEYSDEVVLDDRHIAWNEGVEARNREIEERLGELRVELESWVASYRDAAERNALAEDPDESAEYLISLIKEALK